MPWNEITRKRYERIPMGCSSDVTDGQWAVVSQLLPGRNRLARPHNSALRDIWNAIRYIAASGCARSLLPKDFPPVSTVRCYFHRWRDSCMRSTGPGGHGALRTEPKRFAYRGCHRQCENN